MRAFTIISFMCAALMAGCGDPQTSQSGLSSEAQSSEALMPSENPMPSKAGINPSMDILTEFEADLLENAPPHRLTPVRIPAEPYMDADFRQLSALFSIECEGDGPVSMFLYDNATYVEDSMGTSFITSTETTDPHYSGFFWNRGNVYFDDTETQFPSNDPQVTIKTVLIPKITSSRFMRFEYDSGVGPKFDLAPAKAKIETLVSDCGNKEEEG